MLSDFTPAEMDVKVFVKRLLRICSGFGIFHKKMTLLNKGGNNVARIYKQLKI